MGSQASETDCRPSDFCLSPENQRITNTVSVATEETDCLEKDLHGSADSLAVPTLGESLHTARGGSGAWLLATVPTATATLAAPALRPSS